MPNLTAKVTADISKFTKSMNQTKYSAQSAANSIKIAFAGIAGLTLSLGVKALQTALDYEKLDKRMQVIFGREEGKKFFTELADFAAKSAANTQDLVKTATIMAGIMGTKEKPEFYEAAVFASQQMNKTVLEGSMLLGKFFKTLKDGGGVIDKEIAMQLGQVFGADFMDQVRRGTVTYEQAMKKFAERSKILAIWGEGLGGEINKLGGQWEKFLRKIGEGKNLEAVQNIVAKIGQVLEDLGESGVLEELSKGFADMVESIKIEDVKSFLSSALEIMTFMTKVLQKMIEYWKIIVPLVVAYKTAMIAANIAKAGGAFGGDAGGSIGGGKMGGFMKGLGAAGAVAGVAVGGFMLGNLAGNKIAEMMDPDLTSEKIMQKGPTQAEREDFKLRKQARLAQIEQAKVITGKDDFN